MEKTFYYSDKFKISKNNKGFTFNFLKEKEGGEHDFDFGFRIGLSPVGAKEFLYLLFAAMGEYEEKHEKIYIDPELTKKIELEPIPIGFCPPAKPKVKKNKS